MDAIYNPFIRGGRWALAQMTAGLQQSHYKKGGKKAPGYGMEILGEGLLRSDKINRGTITEGTM